MSSATSLVALANRALLRTTATVGLPLALAADPQAGLTARIGVSQQQVAKLERPGANPSIATLKKIAVALGVRFEFDLVA